MDMLWMLIPDKYEPIILSVALVGFFSSELFASSEWFKGNSWCQLVYNCCKAVVKKFRPDIIMPTIGPDKEVENADTGVEGQAQPISSPEEGKLTGSEP